MKKVIIFIDALKPEEASGFLKKTYQGKIKCHVPRVTPTILGSIYTGTTPGQHGLVRATPFNQQPIQRPDKETFFESLSQKARVLSYMMPFTINVNVQNGVIAQSGVSGSVNVNQPALMIPRAPVSMGKTDPEKAFDSFVDHARIVFSTVRELMRMDASDIFFISYRNIDSYTHWYFDGDFRERLIEYVAHEVREIDMMGSEIELVWFSDHGGCEADTVIRINKWLQEKGYLDLKILEEKHKRQMQQQKQQAQEQDQEGPYMDQIDIQAPYVQVSEDSKFICTDAFDACIDRFQDTTEKEIKDLINELRGTGWFDHVHDREDLYPESPDDGSIPRIIPDRKEGVLVSGNVHPEVPVKTEGLPSDEHDTVVNSRNGDHSPYGAYGGTRDLKLAEVIDPEDLHAAIKKFCRNVTAKVEQAPTVQARAAIPHVEGVQIG